VFTAALRIKHNFTLQEKADCVKVIALSGAITQKQEENNHRTPSKE
jgi:hypothetical protein